MCTVVGGTHALNRVWCDYYLDVRNLAQESAESAFQQVGSGLEHMMNAVEGVPKGQRLATGSSI